MSSHSEPRVRAKKADGVIGAYRFVKLGTDRDHVAQCGAGEAPWGISQNAAAAAEDLVEVHEMGGGSLVQLGGTVAKQDSLKSDANGKAVAAATNLDKAGAIAGDAGVADDVIACQVHYHEKSVV